ncbi:UDP-forming cellulose synthase catalytic subunit [Acidithiobacillus sp. AMEEHan]|uniref:UDP-forming cellulose synthase catalytic subunit n=1 Tax=Acidithiobacillus sp. AMEEHan TaxID=2994951 RepID=UPI0027E52CDE|nr:UDP-forming cellulose synthase catalytic subunit [Acidithiobacillus sp. AMEEHan]
MRYVAALSAVFAGAFRSYMSFYIATERTFRNVFVRKVSLYFANRSWQPRNFFDFALVALICLIIAEVAEVQAPLSAQIYVSCFLIGAMLVLYNWDLHRKSAVSKLLARYAIIFASAYFGWRYLYWRATETMPIGYGLDSEIAGWLLFLAESYGFIMLMFNHLVNINPIDHRIPELPKAELELPFVDVFIPTYNEDLDVIVPTLAAAVNLDYPKSKFQVWFLDDGGTEKKCQQPDVKKAASAKERRDQLHALADRFGAKYLTRRDNSHAKAGNINNALEVSAGDLVAILDCDHIPTRDFLRSTVPFFLHDDKLFLVQTPHNFVTQDPVEKNLLLPRGPGENELFYDVMQPGLDFWGTSYFCGSAAVLREPVLKSLGGIAGQTITEDAETTIDAMRLGYRTLYLNKAMVSGLQPETVTGMVVQRVRWGTGMLQIFLLKNPWFQKGLKTVQKLLYTNLIVYWLFAYSRLILLMAPPAYLIFGITICHTTPKQLLVYLVPYLASSLIVAQHYYRRVRWPFISQVYETLQSVFIATAMTKVFWSPKSPNFKVTPKGEYLDRHFISVLSWPFYVLLLVNIAAILSGVELIQQVGAQVDAIGFVMFWAVLDTLFLLAVLGVAHEKPQRRTSARVPLRKQVAINFGTNKKPVLGNTQDISWRGASVAIDHEVGSIHLGSDISLDFGAGEVLRARVSGMRDAVPGKQILLSVLFDHSDVENVITAVNIAYGSSNDLLRLARERRRSRSILGALMLFMRLALVFGGKHVWHLLRDMPITDLVQRVCQVPLSVVWIRRSHDFRTPTMSPVPQNVAPTPPSSRSISDLDAMWVVPSTLEPEGGAA